MNWYVNWYSAGLAGVAGAIAAAIAAVVVSRLTERKWLYVVVFALVFSVTFELAKEFILPTLTIPREMENVERELLQLPVFQVMKRYDGATYDAFLGDLEAGLRSGKKGDEVIAEIRPRIVELAQRRLPTASNQAVVTYLSVMTRQMRELNRQNPMLCYKFLFPRQYGEVIVSNHLPDELVNADLAGLAGVISASAESPQPVPAQEEVSADLTHALSEVQRLHKEHAAVLRDLHAPNVDMAIGCEVVADLYDIIIALPPERNGKLLRYLLNQG